MHQNWKGLGSYSTVGLEFVLSVLVGLFGGRWLDQKLGTGGILTFIGFGFGIAAGVRSIWRALEKANRAAEQQEKEERDARKRLHGNGKH